MPPQTTTHKNRLTPLIALIVLGGLIFLGLKSTKLSTSTNPTDVPQAVDWPSEQVKKETISDNSKGYEILAYYPVTKSDAITNILKNFVNDQITTFKTDTSQAGEMPEGYRALTLDITYEEIKNANADNYIFLSYSDTGGAHGLSTTTTFAFTKTGKQVSLSDLFTNGTRGLGVIADAVRKDLLKREFADSDWITEGAAPTKENYQNFIIEDAGVTFIFDPYQVAPYSSGTQRVTVPISVFKSIANPEIFGTK